MDGGKHWSDMWDTGIYGQPGTPVGLPDGTLAVIAIDRSTRPVITVRTSRDRGRTLEEELIIYDRHTNPQDSRNMSMNEAWEEMGNYCVGHPHLLHLGHGQLLAYYYAGNDTDQTAIEFVQIRI